MTYKVSVRTLCDFAARRGSLDLRFRSAPSAQEGVAGHRIVASRRPDGYQKEVSLQVQYGALTVRGRADGFDPQAGRLEEYKTYRGRLIDMPESQRGLHWAQARLYGHLLCQTLGLDAVELALVYFNVATEQETTLLEHCTAKFLEGHFCTLCDLFLAWAEQEMAHRKSRDAALQALQLPFDAFRDGQRTLAEAVYRSVRDSNHVAIQAPTGIGKTMGTLFPALKAMPAQDIDKLYFLTAKTSGRGAALQALEAVQPASGPALRVLELTAREQACEHPDKQCNGDSCPLAKGFYDRLGPARQLAFQAGLLDRPTLRQHALKHDVCPYHLSTELLPWCDLIVGDYNYYFDKTAALYAQASSQEWRTVVLVDEAHNLVERARAMYTATLRLHDLQALLQQLKPPAGVRSGQARTKTVEAASGHATNIQASLWQDHAVPETPTRASPPNNTLRNGLRMLAQAWRKLDAESTGGYCRYAMPPESLVQCMRQAAGSLSEHLDQAPSPSEDVLRFYFDLQHFLYLADNFGPHSVFESNVQRGADRLSSEYTLRNVVPAPFLKSRFGAAHACVLFSATLQPRAFYEDVLGLPDETAWLDVQAPFQSSQLEVRVVSDISTRYTNREAALAPMARIIAAQFARRPGNYLVFAGSFDYLHQLAHAFTSCCPEVSTWSQSRNMDEAAKADFLAQFNPRTQGVGFAVLGGTFAEGIDLPGDRLIGAFIATLGLPQVNLSNETLKQSLEAGFKGRGFDYAYLYPGLCKVVQAAERIIRSPEDTGVIYLMDDRYNRPAVRRLLPGWWHIEQTAAAATLSAAQGQAAESTRRAPDTGRSGPPSRPARTR